MKRRVYLQSMLGGAACLTEGRSLADQPVSSPSLETRSGRVVLLSSVLADRKIPADPGPLAQQVVFVESDQSVSPILSDEASRALFLDERLRSRPAELTFRRYPGLPYLQVVSFRVEHEGRLARPEYYCDVCTIAVRYPQVCPCCQGPMELRLQSSSG